MKSVIRKCLAVWLAVLTIFSLPSYAGQEQLLRAVLWPLEWLQQQTATKTLSITVNPSSGFTPLACHAVGPTATGTGSGADFSNLMARPANTAWVRGHAYYLVAGTYSTTLDLQTPNSAAVQIKITRPTSGDHGQSCPPSIAAGYNDSTMGQPAGPATFPNIYHTTRYWIVDGAYHPAGNWWVTGNTLLGYGFYIDNSTGCSTTNCWAISVSNGEDGSFFTVKNIEVKGHGPAGINSSPNRVDDFFRAVGGTTDLTVQYAFLHDSSSTFFKLRNHNNLTVDHVWMNKNSANPTFHAEAISVCAGNNYDVGNSVFENTEGTAAITMLNSGTSCSHDNWKVHGNLFYIDNGEPGHGWGNGVLSCINGNSVSNLYFVNNTIANIQSSLSTRINIPGSADGCPTQSNIFVKNNLWYNSVTASQVANSYTAFDYNSYLVTPTGNDVGAHTVVAGSASSPFVNTTGMQPSDYFLSSNTSNVSPWLNINTTISTNSTDMLGTIRVLSRGAFEKQ